MSTICSLLLLLSIAIAADGQANAANYPTRPVEIIVPFAPGGGLDVATRILAKHAEPELGQRIDVVNRTGGGNIRGIRDAMEAEPDGYVLGAWASGLVTDELLIRNADYTYRDIAPICLFANDPEIIAVGRAFAERENIRTLDDLFAHVRANPGVVTFGVGGNWTTHDFIRLKMEEEAGVKFNRMPYLGGAPAAAAAAVGNCDVAALFAAELLPYLESGGIVPLAVAYESRLPQLPDVPTVAEAGHPGMTQTMWRVLSVPKAAPRRIVDHLVSVFASAMRKEEYLEEARAAGVNPVSMFSPELDEFIARERARYAEKAVEWGIRVR